MINLSMTYELNSKSMMRFFNYYELGISSIYFVFRNEYKRENIDGILVGEIIYNPYFLNMYFNIVEYKPKNKSNNISFMLGLSNYFSSLSSPQKISYYNGYLVEDSVHLTEEYYCFIRSCV